MKSAGAYSFLIMLIATATCSAQTGIGVRSGVSVWHGLPQAASDEIRESRVALDKEIVMRQRISSKWAADIALGHFSYSNQEAFVYSKQSGVREVRTNVVTLSVSLDYQLIRFGKSGSKGTLSGGWAFAGMKSLARCTETFVTGSVQSGRTFTDNWESWMMGPELAFTRTLSSRLSVTGRASFRFDASDVYWKLTEDRAGNQSIANRCSLSAGLFYSF